MEETSQFVVCTRCFTYNQREYIKDALDGFVKQITSFPVVYVIVDDASTDGTPDVIRKYVEDHFNVVDSESNEVEKDYGSVLYSQHKVNKNCYFAVVLLKDNHYGKKSKIPYISQWLDDAKYHAICEGDDYWTDENKLQRQADFLETHPTYSAISENGIELFTETGNKRLFSEEPARIVTIPELIEKRRFPTASVLYRKKSIDERYYQTKIKVDTMLWCMLASKGSFYYDAINSSVYRRGSGITVTLPPYRFAQKQEMWHKELQFYFPEYYSRKELESFLIKAYIAAANRYFHKHELGRFFFLSYFHAFMISPFSFLHIFIQLLFVYCQRGKCRSKQTDE